MRKLWIVRINAASKSLGTSYSKFINDLKKNNVKINRKMLSEIAVRDFNSFKAIHDSLK
jgi:large subunit ribosomal protein L20